MLKQGEESPSGHGYEGGLAADVVPGITLLGLLLRDVFLRRGLNSGTGYYLSLLRFVFI